MRKAGYLVTPLVLTILMVSIPLRGQDQQDKTAKILAAKTVYFDDQSGDAAVGAATLDELKKWGRFQIVPEQNQADLIILLSIDPYHAGSALLPDGKIGVIDANGTVEAEPATDHKKSASSRDAYLTAIEPKGNEVLWSDSHAWGGVLTGANSAGERLVKKLEKDVGK
ncbi:MAG: hypothetical protein WBF06_08380 [Candidatus Acidiferrales bacterium]